MCSEPQRPLTLGTTSARRAGGAAAAPPASDVDTAKGSLAFISRVLTQAQYAAQQQSNALAAEQEQHAATRNRLHRVDAERADTLAQLSTATDSLRELNRLLQSERTHCEQLKLALADERAAHAQTEQARQRALYRLTCADPQQQHGWQEDKQQPGRRQSAAGVGLALTQRSLVHESDGPSTDSSAEEVSPGQVQPERSLADATRALNTPFRNSVSVLQQHLANSTQHGLGNRDGKPRSVLPADGSGHDVGADDVFVSADDWTDDHSGSRDQGSDSAGQSSDDSPATVPPRPVRSRNAPHRWQDGTFLTWHSSVCSSILAFAPLNITVALICRISFSQTRCLQWTWVVAAPAFRHLRKGRWMYQVALCAVGMIPRHGQEDTTTPGHRCTNLIELTVVQGLSFHRYMLPKPLP